MKALVATAAAQSARERSRFECIEGELVWLARPCGAGERYPESRCTCARGFRGAFTDGSTATALVTEVPRLTRDDIVLALTACRQDGIACLRGMDVAVLADELIETAARWPRGIVLARRRGALAPRAFIELGA